MDSRWWWVFLPQGARNSGIGAPDSLWSAEFLKRNQNAPRPSEHPPVRGGGGCRNVYVGSKAANTKPLNGVLTGSPIETTLGQQHDVGEKPTVILYTYIIRHAGTPEETVKTKPRQCSTPSHMVVIIYYCMGYKYKVTTWHLTGFPNSSNLGSTV